MRAHAMRHAPLALGAALALAACPLYRFAVD
jgi:hypothetical protein